MDLSKKIMIAQMAARIAGGIVSKEDLKFQNSKDTDLKKLNNIAWMSVKLALDIDYCLEELDHVDQNGKAR